MSSRCAARSRVSAIGGQPVRTRTRSRSSRPAPTVDDGRATLKGEVSYQFESDAAYNEVASLYGVCGVMNAIKVVHP
jgi:osmotically-inducible protein OsmY